MSDKKKKYILFLGIFILIIILIAIFVSIKYSDFYKMSLSKNKKAEFSMDDLLIDDLSYKDDEKKLVKKYGKPNSSKEFTNNGYKYKLYKYDGMDVTLKEFYDDYRIQGVSVTSRKYKVSRDIKVGNRVSKVVKKYRIANKKSNYMYGNYSSKALEDTSNLDNIYFGKRTKSKIEYVNRDQNISQDTFIPTNIAKLTINYKNNRVTKISWSYDLQ